MSSYSLLKAFLARSRISWSFQALLSPGIATKTCFWKVIGPSFSCCPCQRNTYIAIEPSSRLLERLCSRKFALKTAQCARWSIFWRFSKFHPSMAKTRFPTIWLCKCGKLASLLLHLSFHELWGWLAWADSWWATYLGACPAWWRMECFGRRETRSLAYGTQVEWTHCSLKASC